MNLKNIFRLAVIGYIVAVLMFYALSFTTQDLPVEAASYAQWRAKQPLGVMVQLATNVGIFASLISIGSAFGILFWLRAARPIFATCIFLMLFAELFLGYPTFVSGIQSFLNTLASISAGLIIALSYFSAIADKYQNPHKA